MRACSFRWMVPTVVLFLLASGLPAHADIILTPIKTDATWRVTEDAGNATLGWNTDVGFAETGFEAADTSFGTQSGFGVHNPVLKIWDKDGGAGSTVFFRRTFDITGDPTAGQIILKVDDDAIVWVNGTEVFNDSDGTFDEATVDVLAALKGGTNLIAVQATDAGGTNRSFAAVVTGTSAVPEPSSCLLLLAGTGMIAFRRRRQS